jgi:hypothetical protein
MRVIPVVVKIAAPGLTKIPVSDQVSFLSSRFTASSDRRERLFQKIDAGASGLIVTITTDEKTGLGLPILRPQPQPVTLAACYPGLGFSAGNARHLPKFNLSLAPPAPRNVRSMTERLAKRQVN